MLSKKKKKTVAKKSDIKKSRTISVSKQITAEILMLCAKNDGMMVYEINEADGYAFILKKISVTTFHVQNEGLFCPVDKYTKKDFFSAFYIVWKHQAGIGSSFITEIAVNTPKEAEKSILSYDGETIL